MSSNSLNSSVPQRRFSLPFGKVDFHLLVLPVCTHLVSLGSCYLVACEFWSTFIETKLTTCIFATRHTKFDQKFAFCRQDSTWPRQSFGAMWSRDQATLRHADKPAQVISVTPRQRGRAFSSSAFHRLVLGWSGGAAAGLCWWTIQMERFLGTH